MTDSSLIRCIKLLSAKEKANLLEYLRCDLFNRRKELVLLCQYINTHLAKPSAGVFSPEQLFAAAFPGKSYEYAKLRHTMSYLLEAVRQFLTFCEWENTPAVQQQMRIKALRNRGLDKMFDQSMDKLETKLEQTPVRNAQYFYRQYELLQEKVEHAARKGRAVRIDLQPLPDQLTTFYVAEMLRHACSALMHQAVAGQKYQIQLLEAVLEVARQETMLDTPAIAVYYHAYRMLQHPELDDDFQTLKQLLLQHERRFEASEMRVLYLLAINGCIRRMNAGQKKYIREAFEVYKIALERRFLFEKGYISGFTYKNIIRAGSALEEQEWTEQFAETYKEMLHPNERQHAYNYNRAFLHFQRKEYAQAMRLLLQTELDDPLNNLHAKRMLVRSYYELREFMVLESLLQSFNIYVKRKKNLGYHRDLNLKFILYMQRIIKLKPGPSAASRELAQQIAADKDLAEKEWLQSILLSNHQ